MPDENKFQKLREIGYQVHPACGMCRFAIWRNTSPMSPFGECSKHMYTHRKHTGDQRGISIVLTGGCGEFEADPRTDAALGAFSEFFQER